MRKFVILLTQGFFNDGHADGMDTDDPFAGWVALNFFIGSLMMTRIIMIMFNNCISLIIILDAEDDSW